VIHHFWLLNHFRKDLHFNKKMVNWEAYSNQQLRKYSLWSQKGRRHGNRYIQNATLITNLLMFNNKAFFLV
jgi:hypothetical protein